MNPLPDAACADQLPCGIPIGAALFGADGTTQLHVRLAQRNGLDYEALTAMMTLVTNYIGQARGSQAMEAVQRVAGPGSRRPSPG